MSITFCIGVGLIGFWLGSTVERIFSFRKLRDEITGLVEGIHKEDEDYVDVNGDSVSRE